MENVTRFPARRSRWKRWRDWATRTPSDLAVAWVVCSAMVAAGWWLGRRECRR